MPRIPHSARSTLVATATGVVASVLVVAAVALPASARSTSARAQRAQVRAEQAQVAAQVDALEGDQQEVTAALAALDENVRGQQAVVDDARRRAADADAQAAAADAAIAETDAEIAALRDRVVAYAVDAYISPPEEDVLRRLEAGSAQEDANRRALLGMRSGEDGQVLDDLRAATARLEDERRRAENARAEAEAAAVDAEQSLVSLDQARAEQQAFAAQVRTRLDARLADAAFLSQVDAELGEAILEEQAALVAAVAKVPAPPPASTPAAGAGGSTGGSGSSTAGSGGSSGSGGGGGATTTTTAPPGTTPPTTAPVTTVPRPDLVTVGGITVNAAIAENLRGLLAAAQADGVWLSGYGWRDSSTQIALRMQNCGSSQYAIYQMPPDQCSPPTARPGLSMHEQGLAIDFNVNGRFLTSRSDPAFVWLAANAGRFGFRNLPSEPWHWSTTGG